MDNVKYCGYCDHHFQKINKKLVKTIPAFRPASGGSEEGGSPTATPDKSYPGAGGGAAKETAAKPQLNASSSGGLRARAGVGTGLTTGEGRTISQISAGQFSPPRR